MSSTFDFAVRAFGCNVHVETTCVETYAILERYIFPWLPKWLPKSTGADGRTDLLIRVDRVGDQFQLSVNGVAVVSAAEVISLMPDVIRALDEAVVERLTSMRAVHAGAVLWRGRVLLLPGMSHAGKSSLVAELLRRGATYFSDEYALIDPEGRVHPYPRPLLLRNGRPEQVPVLAGECSASVGDAPAPVGWILSLQYHPEGSWSIEPVTQGEALLNLLRNTPHVLAESPEMVAIFQRAVAGANCYVGHRAEAAHAVDEILELVGKAA
jgi:hypothetical protein